MAAVGYNPDDPTQQSFLSALALGETGTTPWSAIEGVHGTNLSSYATDEYGFPQWGGFGNSHAAGTFQFQPATWDAVAQQYGLNFQNPQDQSAAAWYVAQDTYAKNNNGASLEDALANGDLASVQSSLAKVWPSVTGNASNPGGLASAISSGIGKVLGTGTTASTDGQTGTAGSSSGTSVGGLFVRGALIIIGALILVVALWQLASSQGYVPSPGTVAKSAVAFAGA